jgi:hypothetical protein
MDVMGNKRQLLLRTCNMLFKRNRRIRASSTKVQFQCEGRLERNFGEERRTGSNVKYLVLESMS